jgi:hypothetical protein
MTIWRNPDGLVVKFPLDTLFPRDPRGELPGAGTVRECSVIVDALQDLVNGTTFIEWGAVIPRNSYIVEAGCRVLVTITGTTAITFGAIDYSGATVDAAGFLLSIPAFTQGTQSAIVKGGTGAGALLGTISPKPWLLTITPTGTGTAGKFELYVKYLVPGKDTTTTF